MDKEDARKQTLAQFHEWRKQIVQLHKQGMGVMQIVAMAGLSYPTVRTCIDLFEAGGWAAIKPAPRGRLRGAGRVLTVAREHAHSTHHHQSPSRAIEDGLLSVEPRRSGRTH